MKWVIRSTRSATKKKDWSTYVIIILSSSFAEIMMRGVDLVLQEWDWQTWSWRGTVAKPHRQPRWNFLSNIIVKKFREIFWNYINKMSTTIFPAKWFGRVIIFSQWPSFSTNIWTYPPTFHYFRFSNFCFCVMSCVSAEACYKATHSKWISRVRWIYVSIPAFQNRNGESDEIGSQLELAAYEFKHISTLKN